MRAGTIARLVVVCGLILLAAPNAWAVIDYDLVFTGNFTGSKTILKMADGHEEGFRHTLTNTGTEADTYELTISAEYYTGDFLGFGWTLCDDFACVTPGVPVIRTFQPAESDTFTVKIFLFFDQEGGSKVTLTCQSLGDPSQVVAYQYAVIRTGTDVVVIDDDGGDAYEQYLLAGLASGASHAVYDTGIQSLPDADFDFSDQHHLIYISGDQSTNTITTDDAAVLGDYLDAGGRLVASGQDLFDDIAGTPFARDYLAEWRLATTTQTQVQGAPGSPVGGGLLLDLTGGADNQVSPDVVTGGLTSMSYAGAGAPIPPWSGACMRREQTAWKTVSFGFGLESVAAAPLGQLLGQISNWFDAALVATPDVASVTGPVSAWPNPVRASGHLRFTLPDGYAGAVRIDLFDAGGRSVGTLHDGIARGGAHELPIDLGGRSLPPGVYHYRIAGDGFTTAGKLAIVN